MNSRFRATAGLCLACLLFAPGIYAGVILQLRILEGGNAAYGAGSRVQRPWVVQVTDETGNPVAGVAVTFHLPEDGATGAFPSGLRTEVATTGADGKASIAGVQWNKTSGPVKVKITAAKDKMRAGVELAASLSETKAVPQVAKPAVAVVQPKPVSAAPEPAPKPTLAIEQPAAKATAPVIAPPPKPPAPPTEADRAVASPKIVPQPASGGEGTFHASSRIHKKWIIISAAVAAGAAGAVLARSSHPAAAAAPVSGPPQIGAPSITIGHP